MHAIDEFVMRGGLLESVRACKLVENVGIHWEKEGRNEKEGNWREYKEVGRVERGIEGNELNQGRK